MNEFELIRQFFNSGQGDDSNHTSGVVLGIGDDAAVLQPISDHQMIVSVDTLVSGVHFPETASAYDIGWRTLAVNLSDLAAMGVTPRWFTLALTIPTADESWLQSFSQGLFDCASRYQIKLVGGDTTAGPLTLTVQVIGETPNQQFLSRSGAAVGDGIYLTGYVGDAIAGLGIVQGKYSTTDTHERYLLDRFMKPTPRVEAGLALSTIASAAIDISDGVIADLGHIAEASQLSAALELGKIPVSEPLIELLGKSTAQQLALSAGDDYELCFTVSAVHQSKLPAIFETLELNYSQIGEMKTGTGVSIQGEKHPDIQHTNTGYQHFS